MFRKQIQRFSFLLKVIAENTSEGYFCLTSCTKKMSNQHYFNLGAADLVPLFETTQFAKAPAIVELTQNFCGKPA